MILVGMYHNNRQTEPSKRCHQGTLYVSHLMSWIFFRKSVFIKDVNTGNFLIFKLRVENGKVVPFYVLVGFQEKVGLGRREKILIFL